jgi:hypothetical protein
MGDKPPSGGFVISGFAYVLAGVVSTKAEDAQYFFSANKGNVFQHPYLVQAPKEQQQLSKVPSPLKYLC